MMYRNFLFNNGGNMWGGGMDGIFGLFLAPLVIWTIVWKGYALWKAARREDKIWFIVLLIVNTLGILDILYIYLFSKETSKKSKKK